MRILHIIDTLGRGGAETLLVNTIKDLPQYHHTICYLGGAEDFLEDCQQFGDVFRLNFHGIKDLFSGVRQLKKILKEQKIDLIHSHLMTSTLLARSVHGKTPLVSTVHSMLSQDSFSKNKIALHLERLTYSRDDYFIFVSQSAKDDYKKFIKNLNIDRSPVFHNYVEDTFINNLHQSDFAVSKILKLVAVGNLKYAKNYDNLIRAFTHLKELPIQLDIYGVGELREDLQKIITNQQLNVTLKGRSENIVDVLQQYDAYLMGSLHEGFGIAAAEAMCLGLPLVLSEIGPLKEIAENRAVYFNPRQPQDIAEQISWVYHHWDEFMHISRDNKAWATARYAKENYLNKLTGLYEQVLNNDR